MDDPYDFDDANRGNDRGDDKGNEAAVKAIVSILGVIVGALALPAIVVAFGMLYIMLHWLRQRPTVSGAFTVVALLVLSGCWFALDAGSRFMEYFSSITLESWRTDLPMVLPAYIIVALALGFIAGQVLIMWEAHRMKIDPHLTRLAGSWQYNFSYRRSPWQLLERKKRVKKLRAGDFVDDERSPLGIDESDGKDDVVYRYADESTRHTLISGTVGSGKALHKGTVVPTPTGFSTVGDLGVGNKVFDGNGGVTTITGKHQPLTEDHYELRLPGVAMRACGDHLWPVKINGADEVILSTREIFSHYSAGSEIVFSTIGKPIEFDKTLPQCPDFENIFSQPTEFVSEYLQDIVFAPSGFREEFVRFVFRTFGVGDGVLEIPSHLDFDQLRVVCASVGYHTVVTGYNDGFVKISVTAESDLPVAFMQQIVDSPEDYYCFTVDSEDHLFAVTPFFVRTHNTITELSLIRSDMEAGKTVVVVDFKRAPEVAGKLSAWSHDMGANFYHFTEGDPADYNVKFSPGQSAYDPLSNPNPSFRADMLLGMREYDQASEVYRVNMQQVLQILLNGLANVDRSSKHADVLDFEHGGLLEIASAIANTNLMNVADACAEGSQIRADMEYLASQVYSKSRGGSAGLSNSVTELRGQLQTLLASSYGRWFKTNASSNARDIDLYKLTSQPGNVILFSISSDEQPAFASFLGSLIFADLRAVSARRLSAGIKEPVGVYVDEFQSIPPTAVTAMLEKSRESGMGVTLAQQSFEQIISAAPSNGEAFLNKIMDTCGNFIIHAGSTHDSAVRLSKIIGEERQQKLSANRRRNNWIGALNFWNRRESIVSSQESVGWKYDPQNFMQLSSPSRENSFRSTAVLINKMSMDPKFRGATGAVAREVWMIPDDAVLGSYFKPKLGVDSDELADSVSRSLDDVIASEDMTESFSSTVDEYDVSYDGQPQYADDFDDDGDFSWEDQPAPPEIEEPVSSRTRSSSSVDNVDEVLDELGIEFVDDEKPTPRPRNRFNDVGRFDQASAPPPIKRKRPDDTSQDIELPDF